MNYSEKLKDPRWQKKRLEILERDGWKCRACGDTETTLHVHHIFYLPKKEPWEIPNGFLITFCEGCHKSLPCVAGIDKCEQCSEYGVDCDGTTNESEAIQNAISSLLNVIWATDKTGDYLSALSFVHLRIA
jgi:hypothetical protein